MISSTLRSVFEENHACTYIVAGASGHGLVHEFLRDFIGRSAGSFQGSQDGGSCGFVADDFMESVTGNEDELVPVWIDGKT